MEREVRGWFDRCRHVSLCPSVLLRCPDAETAARVIAAVGDRKATPISDTVIELHSRLHDTGRRSALIRKLRAQGVFVDPRPPGTHPS